MTVEKVLAIALGVVAVVAFITLTAIVCYSDNSMAWQYRIDKIRKKINRHKTNIKLFWEEYRGGIVGGLIGSFLYYFIKFIFNLIFN